MYLIHFSNIITLKHYWKDNWYHNSYQFNKLLSYILIF